MTHYVCTGGCDGVSTQPGTCQAASCPRHGHPLVVCDCADGQHKEVFAAAKTTESDSKP